MSAPTSPLSPAARFTDAKGCGARYGFSWRHWLRLVDAGKAPPPIRFGRLVRWNLDTLEEWERTGCLPVRDFADEVRDV
jgi:predicted DNA-binding transcriptional regulator AlpA